MTNSEKSPRDGTGSERAATLQLEEWVRLREHLLDVESLPDGRVLHFPGGMLEEVRELTSREAARCAFLRFDVHAEQADVAVTITSDDPEALGLIAELAGESA